jgi:DNA-binding MarR family transcriptional regulator
MTQGHRIAMGLRTAYWAMHRQSDSCFRRRRVTADQFVLLALLAEKDGTTQQELVRRASSDRNTVRAMLVRLEERGLIARQQHPTDGRALRVTLTRKGRQIYERLWTESEPIRQRLVAAVGPEQAEALVQALTRVSQAMTPKRNRCSGAPTVARSGRSSG